MRIQTKLILLVGIVSISFIFVAGMYLSTLSEMSELNRGLRNGHAMIAKVWKLQSATQDLMLTDSLPVAYDGWQRATAELAEYHDRFLGNEAIAVWADRQGAGAQYENAISFFDAVNTQIDDFATGYEEVAADLGQTSGGLFREVHLNRNMRYLFLNNKATSLIAYLGDTTEKVVVRLVDLLEETYRQLQERITIISLAVTIAIVAAISGFILFFTRSIRRSFRGIEATMHELSCGDFTKHLEVRGRDELASLSTNINSFIDQFSEIIRKIKDTSDRTVELRDELSASTDDSSRAVADIAESINSIAGEVEDLKSTLEDSGAAVRDISSSIDLLAQQIESQSSAVAESSSSIEEMAASIKNVARVADSKQEATDKLVAVTKSGGEKVTATDAIVEDITERVNSMMEIIGIINKIASQTNMLSMNAAIEAAHAGDAGRGFSVVAEEIRNLSESTNLNAKKIRETLQEIRNRADEAQALSKESSASFQQIFTEVDGVTQALREIASTMDELSVGSNEILSSTGELTQTTTVIRETSGSIQERTTRIDASMQEVRSFAEQLSSRIAAVDVAAGGIRTAIGHVAEISARNSDNISELSAEVNQFVVDGCSDDTEADRDGTATADTAADSFDDGLLPVDEDTAAPADESSADVSSADENVDASESGRPLERVSEHS